MLESDKRGRIVRTRRHIDTRVHVEMLIGSDWVAVAQAELLKLQLMVDGYKSQLEDSTIYDDLCVASQKLKHAVQKLEEENEEDERSGSLL